MLSKFSKRRILKHLTEIEIERYQFNYGLLSYNDVKLKGGKQNVSYDLPNFGSIQNAIIVFQ